MELAHFASSWLTIYDLRNRYPVFDWGDLRPDEHPFGRASALVGVTSNKAGGAPGEKDETTLFLAISSLP